ncbi:AAA family ATPase [Agrococcus casei]|uniref:MinD/ParA family ATP-binding protein n=1 Tax=Agrococcus casei TaxID=343512 RepID=UPI003F8EE9D5
MNHAIVHADVTADLSLDGRDEHLEAMTLTNLRRDIIHRTAEHAAATGSTVSLVITDIDAVATLAVHPDGKVEETAPRQPRTAGDEQRPATPVAAAPAPSVIESAPVWKPQSDAYPATGAPEPEAAAAPVVPSAAPVPSAAEAPSAAEPADAPSAPEAAPAPQAAPVSDAPSAPNLSTPQQTLASWRESAAPSDSSAAPAADQPGGSLASPPARPEPSAPIHDTRPPRSAPAAQQAAPSQQAPSPQPNQPQTSAPQPTRAQQRPTPKPAQQSPQAAPPLPSMTQATPAAAAAHPSAPAEPRKSFLVQETVEEPAQQGFRGFMTKMGAKVAPSERERAERADEQAVSQHWPGPRTIAVVNGKGGAGKTPTTILLSAILARYGGAGVLAWDNNQTRGTLGWRTEQGPHESTLLDLLPNVQQLLGTGAQSADLASYVHHQTRDRYDVLRSKPMALAAAQRISGDDVDAIHAVASKYYRLVVIDSGNDESDPLWLQMIDHADQIVVATTTRDDHAEAGALLLDALRARDERSAKLAANAVAIVNQADPKESKHELRRVSDGYREFAREVVAIPHDPAMVDGLLRLGSLDPTTQRAWLAAGAAVARGL